MVFVAGLTATLKVPFATPTCAGFCPQPEVSVALQVAALMTATLLKAGPSGTYRVLVSGFSPGGPGFGPTVMSGGAVEQPLVWAALHAAVSITATFSLNGSAAYNVCVP